MRTEEYIAMMEQKTKGLNALSTGFCPECKECADDSGYEDLGRYFSWANCEICGTGLGGDRYIGHYVNEDNEIVHFDSVCVDCDKYIANGDIPTHGPDGNEITDD